MCVLFSTSIPVGLFVCLPQIVALTKHCVLWLPLYQQWRAVMMCTVVTETTVLVSPLQLEKLNSSPPAKSSHAHPPPLAPPPTTTAGETHGPVADYRGFPRPASSGRKREGFPSGPGKRETSSGKKEPQKAGSERASRRAREEGRRGRREKDGCVSLSTPASHKSTAIPSPHPHTSTTLPSSHPHSNSTAMFGPPVSFESPIPHSGNSPTPEDKYSKPSRVSQSSSPKINLPEGNNVDVIMTPLPVPHVFRHSGDTEVKGRGSETGCGGHQLQTPVSQTAPGDLCTLPIPPP